MIKHKDKQASPLHTYFNKIFSITARSMALPAIASLLLFSNALICQCPDKQDFKAKINTVYYSPVKKIETQIKELLVLRNEMKACHLEKDSSFMFLLQRLGILYFKQSDYQGAIRYTTESIVAARECAANHSCNTQALVHNYSNLFNFYHETSQLEEKYAAIDSCILYFLKGGGGTDMAYMTISALLDKTDYLFNKGEYSLCNSDAKLGEEITRKYYHGADSIQYMVSFVNKQAHFLYFSKKNADAEKILEARIPQFIQAGYSDQLYAFYGLLGLINRDRRNYTKALTCFQLAFHASSKIKYDNGCAQNLANTGMLYAQHFNNRDKGLKYCADALFYADAADSLFIIMQTAQIYVLKGMYDKAQSFLQQAFDIVQPGMNENTMLQNSFQFPGFNLLQNLSDLTTQKGDAYVQQYRQTSDERYLKKALAIYKKGDLFLAKIKTDQQLQFSSNLVWRTTARNLYEHAIEACHLNNNIEDAFYFFEKSRAVLLNDQINEQRWMADADIAKQAVIKKTINDLERNLAALPASAENYLAIQNKLNTAYQQMNVLARNIKQKNPLFYQNYLDTVFLSVNELRKKILNNAATLVELFAGDSAVYVLTIAPRDQRITRIDKQQYEEATGTFKSFIINHELLNKNFNGFVKSALGLKLLLFDKIVPPDGSIIISPDGAMYPFEALVMNAGGTEPDYFLQHYATSYAYSVRYLTNQFAVNKNDGSSVLGFAPVLYKKQFNLAELHGSDRSLEKINDYFGNATNYVMEQATRSNFLQNFPRYNIIQLYTHAADSSGNNDPVIYFSDSAFYLSELIPASKPVTQLVVLSACETANGKLYQGEGIFSFNRGFAALGIPAAVSNLWSVDNESTYLITELFYKYLAQGFPTDVALQQSKLEFMRNSTFKEKKLPYFWAGSILTGKAGSIKNAGRFPWGWLAATATLLLVGIFVTRQLIRKNIARQKQSPGKAA